MKARPGDWLVVESLHQGEPKRKGLVLEVHHADGSPPYLVRWADSGHEGLIFPGPDSHIVDEEPTEEVADTAG